MPLSGHPTDMKRTANAHWRGDLKSGQGDLSTASGVLTSTPYSFHTRFEDGKGTNPEELLAAAHAGCFAMSLAGELREAEPHLEVRANVVMDEVEGKGHVIVESQLRVRARATVDEETFHTAVAAADEGCPFSQLIKASARVTIEAELEE